MERLVKVFRHSALPVFPSIVIMDPSTPDKRLVQRIQTMHDVWLLQVRAGERGWRGTVAPPPLAVPVCTACILVFSCACGVACESPCGVHPSLAPSPPWGYSVAV
jgi:hypothetical protein